MKRSALVLASLLCSFAFAPTTLAQAAKAAPATQAAQTTPAKAKWIPPVKGTVNIDVVRGTPKKVGNDMVTVLKIKNTSSGSIALLKVDEYWYDKNQKIVSADTETVRQPILPGQVIEVTTKSPIRPNLYMNQFMFSHVNGQVKVNSVKKIE